MTHEFSGAELRLARLFHGFSLEEVGERVGKSRQYVHKLEANRAVPTDELRSSLAAALQVTPDFFFARSDQAVHEEQFHYRKLMSTRVSTKQTVQARAELLRRVVVLLDKELKLPAVRIPQFPDAQTPEEIERAAEVCRREWGLGLGPVANMFHLAEHVGAVVATFQSVSKEVDALSFVVHRPIIVRNDAKESICRQRFDVGHELGHSCLHDGRVTGDRLTEQQANRFSGALLLPRTMMAKLFPRPRGSRLDWKGLRDFKLTWKASKAAILYRARQLELLTDAQYRSAVITLKRTGEAVNEHEDGEISPEYPSLLKQALKVLVEQKGHSIAGIAEALGINQQMLSDIVGETFQVGPDAGNKRERPRLYVVR